jgi:hypothetical protein
VFGNVAAQQQDCHLWVTGVSPGASAAIRKFGTALKSTLEELFGPTLHLDARFMEMAFPGGFERMHIGFYRSKITSWMAAQEEEYRYGANAVRDPLLPTDLNALVEEYNFLPKTVSASSRCASII